MLLSLITVSAFQFEQKVLYFVVSSISIFLKHYMQCHHKFEPSQFKQEIFQFIFNCRFSIFKLQFKIKRIQVFNIIRFCITFISMGSSCYFYFFDRGIVTFSSFLQCSDYVFLKYPIKRQTVTFHPVHFPDGFITTPILGYSRDL